VSRAESISRRRFVGLALGGTAVSAVALGRVGHNVASGLPRLERHTVTVAGLGRDLDGFRMALVTDVHAGPDMDGVRMEAVVDRVRSLGADLVLLGGDQIDARAGRDDRAAFRRAFARLEAPDGVAAVLGNHEYMGGVDAALDDLDAAGLPLLRGACRLVVRGESAFALLGLDDPDVPEFDPPRDAAVDDLVARAPGGLPRVLVTHRPGAFDAAARHGIALTLAGHTHGGQIGAPLRDLTPVRLATRYVRGRYRQGDSDLIVSSGVGTSGPPIRLGVPPAIVEVTLRTAPAREAAAF